MYTHLGSLKLHDNYSTLVQYNCFVFFVNKTEIYLNYIYSSY